MKRIERKNIKASMQAEVMGHNFFDSSQWFLKNERVRGNRENAS